MDFLDYVFQDRDVSARTRNNYRGWLYTLAEWMIERDYITSNPVEGIKNLREDTKKRDPLTMHQLKELRAYLNKTGEQHFLLACMLEYYAFIRPNELCFLRIGDIKVSEQKIVVDGSWSKNRRDEAVGLNQKILRLMIKLGIFRYPSDYYLFGKKFFPSEEQADSRIFREKFMKIRDILGWKDSIQFYSLKDSGIRDLANAAGIVIARDQARHADITTTNRYLKGDASAVHEETKTFDGNL
jgi:integrase